MVAPLNLEKLNTPGPGGLMTHKYRGCIAVFSISKSVEPNEEQKVLTSGLEHEFSINT